MDYLTFTTVYTMIIMSWCGFVYLGKQCIIFIRWLFRAMLKEEERDG